MIEKPVLIHEDALLKPGFALPLHFDVDEHAERFAVLAPDMNQLIHGAPSDRSFRAQALHLLVEKFKAARPVNLGMNLREKSVSTSFHRLS
jgi:hypothetical protein